MEARVAAGHNMPALEKHLTEHAADVSICSGDEDFHVELQITEPQMNTDKHR
jgi:hypothetical protein